MSPVKCKFPLSSSEPAAGATGSPLHMSHFLLSVKLVYQRHAQKALLQKCSRTMSRRFTPDERCLGGVQEIYADYTNMRRKLLTAKPQVPISADLQPATSFLSGT